MWNGVVFAVNAWYQRFVSLLPVILDYEQHVSFPRLVSPSNQKKRFLQALEGRSLAGPHWRAALRYFGSEPVAFAIESNLL